MRVECNATQSAGGITALPTRTAIAPRSIITAAGASSIKSGASTAAGQYPCSSMFEGVVVVDPVNTFSFLAIIGRAGDVLIVITIEVVIVGCGTPAKTCAICCNG